MILSQTAKLLHREHGKLSRGCGWSGCGLRLICRYWLLGGAKDLVAAEHRLCRRLEIL